MNLVDTIKKYKTSDEEELAYKESFLQFLNQFDEKDWGSRDNLIGHLTSSAWVVNKDRSKVLFAHHNTYNSWAWLGGHADGDLDLLNVACKEAMEESGIKNVKPLMDDPIDLSVLSARKHTRKGKFISGHLHYNVTYLLEADENEALQHQPDENSDVAWIEVKDLFNKVSEEWRQVTYNKIVNKVKKLGL